MPGNKIIYSQGDEVAIFSDLVTSSYWKLRQYALSLLPRDADTADDLVQEAYLRVLDYMRRGGHVFSHFESSNRRDLESIMLRYMHTVIKNVYLSMIMQYSHSNVVSLDDPLRLTEAQEVQDLDEYSNVERVVVGRELTAEVRAYVDKLPKGMGAIVKLKLDGLSPRDIAAKLSISPGAVRVTVSRAARLLREMIVKSTQSSFTTNQQNRVNSYEAAPTIVNGIAQLPDPYKIVVALRDMRRMSYRQIAHTLNRNLGTVKSQYYRGKKRLEALDSHGGSSDSSKRQPTESTAARLAHIEELTDNNWREAVRLYHIQGLTYREVAKKLGRTEGTIKGWVSRAMKVLQQYVDLQYAPSGIKPSSRRRSYTPENMPEPIKALNRKYRPIMELYYIQSDSTFTIAAKLGIPQKDVESKIKQARKYLNKYYPGWCDAQNLKSAM